MKAYSNDLRERAVAAVMAGETTRSVAERFDVAVSSVIKWHQRFRETGSVAPGKMGGHRKVILAARRDFIIEAINTTSHLTVRGPQAQLAERGVKVSHKCGVDFSTARGIELQKKPVRR